MNTVGIKGLRQEIKRSIDFADDKTVKMIYAMLEVEQREDAWTDESFIAEMERRTKEYESGTAQLFTLDEMENNARLAFKQHK